MRRSWYFDDTVILNGSVSPIICTVEPRVEGGSWGAVSPLNFMTANVTGSRSPPPGPGETTITFPIPGFARSDASNLAFTIVGARYWV